LHQRVLAKLLVVLFSAAAEIGGQQLKKKATPATST
jgi:hypothetical protein